MNPLRYMALVPILMMVASVWVGSYRYVNAKNEMRRDLNQALRHLVTTEQSRTWLCDSLSSLPDAGVLTPANRRTAFHLSLSNSSLRDTAHFSLCLLRPDARDRFAEEAAVCSDTLLWHVPQSEGMVVALKAFANPSVASIFRTSRPAAPLATFFSGLLLMGLLFVRKPQSAPQAMPPATPALSLTPMQQQLIDLFRNAPEQTLTKEEICAALWPRKENADDSLYTFISRLKTSLKKQSGPQIQNRRGREYVLVD